MRPDPSAQLDGLCPRRPPFVRVPFDQLPEVPAVPHGYGSWVERPIDGAPGTAAPVVVRRVGSGRPTILLHGLMTDGYSFRYLADAWRERRSLWIPDLPGAGSSAPLRGPHTIDALAEVLRAVIAEVRAEEGATPDLIANSMGGLVALRAVLADPTAVRRFVIVHSPARIDLRLRLLHTILSVPGAPRLLASVAGWDPERWIWRNVHYWDERWKSREECRHFGRVLSKPEGGLAFASWMRDGLAPAGIRALLADAGRGAADLPPTCLLYTRRDPIVPSGSAEALAAVLPQAELKWIEEGSHFAHVDAQPALLGAIDPFLDR